MLYPEYLQTVSDKANIIADELQTKVLKEVVKRFEKNRKLNPKEINNLQILQEAGILLKDIQKLIAKESGKSYKDIAAAFKEAGITAVKTDNLFYRRAGIDLQGMKAPTASPYYMRLMERNYKATAGTFQNLTGTYAIESQKLFINTLNEYFTDIAMGLDPLNTAYRKAINKIINEGDRIYYQNNAGKITSTSIEAATARALRTGISQMSAEISLARMDENDIDLVLVSSHLGARPEHALWQGKVYSRSGASKKYRSLKGATGYGTVRGLCGANCRHSFGPYFEGMINPFERYDKKENDAVYERSQRQRAYERRIRKTKRDIEALSESESFLREEKEALLKRQIEAYADYCAENHLRPLPDRLAIARQNAYGPNEVIEAEEKGFKKDYDSFFAKTLQSCGDDGIDIYNETIDIFNAAPDSMAKKIYEKILPDIEVKDLNYYTVDKNGKKRKGSCYKPGTNALHLNRTNLFEEKKYRNDGSVMFHEIGHFIDFNLDKTFPMPAYDQVLHNWARYNCGACVRYKDGIFGKTLRKEIKDRLREKGGVNRQSFYEWERYFRSIGYRDAGSLMDLFGGAVKGKWLMPMHHDAPYWKAAKSTTYYSANKKQREIMADAVLGTEAFAEFMEATISSPKQMELFKELLPDSWKIFEEMTEALYANL